jgi:hypothetical protein
VFGSSVFYKIDCVDDKEPTLAQYANSGLLWIEDHVKNFTLGESLGLNAKLMDHSYNKKFVTENRIFSWKDV